MKRLNVLLLFLSIFLLGSPTFAQSGDAILEFRSDINVHSTAEIDIVETITFQPSSFEERHGLEWSIPYVYDVGAFRRPTELEINSVEYYPVDSPSQITTNLYSRYDENGWATLRIGSANILITQPHVYIIDYTLKYTGISYFKTHDELYLNIIGPGWKLPIDNASATVTMPTEISEAVCYTGPDGSEQKECTFEINNNVLTVRPNDTLPPLNGYTIALKQPVGTFENTTKEQARLIILANIGILLPIPVAIILFVFLKKYRKGEPKTVIPQYNAPAGFDVLSSGILYKDSNSLRSKYISALLIEMCTKGYCKIKEYKKKKYEIIKLAEFPLESPHAISILTSIFAHGDTVSLDKLTDFYTTSITAYHTARNSIEKLGYYSTKRVRSRNFLRAISIIAILICFFAIQSFIGISMIGTLIGIIISSILLFIFSQNFNIKSELGEEKYAELMGLKMYIETAEEDKIKFHNDPERYKERFEKLLPYAMIFGLEKKWAQLFEDIYTTSPQWYEGQSSTFDTMLFANSISSFNRSFSTYSSPPTSSYDSSGGYRSSGWSSGSSGFSGGGSSGGSSGGGGGGSGGGGW